MNKPDFKRNPYRCCFRKSIYWKTRRTRTIDNIKLYIKEKRIKTEAAFAKILNLEGNPYEELLKLEMYSDEELPAVKFNYDYILSLPY